MITADHLIERLNELRNDISKIESYRLVADLIALVELSSAVAEEQTDENINRLYEFLA
jgi:hypothetical protein